MVRRLYFFESNDVFWRQFTSHVATHDFLLDLGSMMNVE